MILVVDNYDSFTWNLVEYLRQIGAEVRVERNDALAAADAVASGAAGVLISPGPGAPDEALVFSPLPDGISCYMRDDGSFRGSWVYCFCHESHG